MKKIVREPCCLSEITGKSTARLEFPGGEEPSKLPKELTHAEPTSRAHRPACRKTLATISRPTPARPLLAELTLAQSRGRQYVEMECNVSIGRAHSGMARRAAARDCFK